MRTGANVDARLKGYPVTFWLALGANVFYFFSFQATFPVLPRYIADIVVHQPSENVGGQVGLATTVLSLVAVLIRIPTGQPTDRFGRRRFLFVGAACFTLAPLIYMVSRGMPILLMGRAVQGVGLATFSTAFQAFVTDLAPAHRRGEALGLAGASVSIAFITAPLAGDWVAVELGYVPFFQISAATAAASMLLVILVTEPSTRELDPSSPATKGADENVPLAMPGLRLALAQKGVRAGVLTMAALGIPFGAFITFLPLFADERQIAGVGVVFSVYAGTVLLAQPIAGWLSDRLGRRGVILPGLFINGLATVVLAVGGSLWTFTLAGIIFGLGAGLARGGVDALVQDSVPSTLRGTAAALQYTSFDFWIGLGSLPIGLLASAVSYATAFVVTGVACVMGGGGLAVMLRNVRGEGTVPEQTFSSGVWQ